LRRLAAIRAGRPALERAVARYLLGHYRLHRALPKGPATALLPARRLNTIISRAEIEHRTGATQLMAALRRLADKIGNAW